MPIYTLTSQRPLLLSAPQIIVDPQESAIKFVSYEHSKVLLAQYWDNVSDVSELSSSSRFFAGGVGGITSQFAIYGLETLKTRIQTDLGPASGMKGVGRTMREMWAAGGIRVFYRGLTVSTCLFVWRRSVAVYPKR
jgi:solute carrier family 25 phosphate transporter 23/24/25/41